MNRPRRRGGPRNTIIDVARVAQVSTATVSRYLNDPGLVAQATGERVREAILELRYIPNTLAGSLASSSSKVVAIVVPGLTNSIAEETVEALVSRLSSRGVVPLLGVTHLDSKRLTNITMAALGMQAKALIFTNVVPPDLRDLLARTGTTVIEIWGLPRDPVDVAIGFSHTEVGQALAEFAHANGYRRPHLVSAESVRGQIRGAAFADRWRELTGMEASSQEIPIPLDHGDAPHVLEEITHLPERPDLLVVGSDILAYALVLRLREQGVAVPGELGVIGFGDLALATAITPAITTVRIDGQAIADRVIEVLDQRASGASLAGQRINCGFEILRRESA